MKFCLAFIFAISSQTFVGTYIVHCKKSFGGKAQEAQQQKMKDQGAKRESFHQSLKNQCLSNFPEHALYSAIFYNFGCG